jgi:hypothetical protein
MPKLTDKRQALQREALRVKSALDDFADLARPKSRPPAAGSMAFGTAAAASPMIAPIVAKKSIERPIPTERIRITDPLPQDVQSAGDDFFGEMNDDAVSSMDSRSQIDSSDSDGSDMTFTPGISDDFREGFDSESDIPAKTSQDTLSVPVMSVSDNTPPNGSPRPTEAINDILDGFEW